MIDGNLAMANSQQYDSEEQFNEAYESFMLGLSKQQLIDKLHKSGTVIDYEQIFQAMDWWAVKFGNWLKDNYGELNGVDLNGSIYQRFLDECNK